MQDADRGSDAQLLLTSEPAASPGPSRSTVMGSPWHADHARWHAWSRMAPGLMASQGRAGEGAGPGQVSVSMPSQMGGRMQGRVMMSRLPVHRAFSP